MLRTVLGVWRAQDLLGTNSNIGPPVTDSFCIFYAVVCVCWALCILTNRKSSLACQCSSQQAFRLLTHTRKAEASPAPVLPLPQQHLSEKAHQSSCPHSWCDSPWDLEINKAHPQSKDTGGPVPFSLSLPAALSSPVTLHCLAFLGRLLFS